MKLSREINVRFILMVIMLLGFWLKSSAELPFKNAQEFTDYVRNLDLDKLEPIKSVEELLDPVGKEPTDPVLTKGIKLFNDGKIEDAIKYFQKITKKWKKYSQWQRQYAQYQLFHIEKFGMLDPLYNGRPTTLDRSGGTIYGEYIHGYDWDIESDKLILSAIYPHIQSQSTSWRYLTDSKSYYDNYKWFLKDKIDLDVLHVLLKASFGNDSKGWLKNFPNVVKLQGYHTYVGNEFPKKKGPFKSVDDYVSTAKQLPMSPRIRKALELARIGDDRKAYKLFKKIGGDYANYQQWHLANFNETDPYYDGRPSKIYRGQRIPERFIDEPKKYGKDRVWEDDQTYITIYALQDSSINLLKDYFYRVKPGKSDSSDDIVLSKDELDIFDMLINRVFPVGGDDVVSRSLQFKIKHAYEGDNLKNDLYGFQNNMNFIPLLQRMKISKSNNFGIGMSADELYSEAMKILPPLPELKLDNCYEWKDREKLYDAGMTYLLRSAFWGNTKALNAFIVYNAMYINSERFRNKKVDYYTLDRISKKQKKLVDILCEMSLLDKPELKPVLYAYKSLFDESYAYHHANYEREEQRIRREQEKFEQQRREEKARMWLGIANTLIQGAQQIANIYAQSSTMKQQQAKQTKQKGGSDMSLAKQMEDPNFFDRQYRMLMQAADQMVRQKDWNDYCTMRAMMQQMGMDLSYEEYKMNQAKALMDLKEQGIDLVAEQRARSQEMHDFYRSQMNSGKENVERIKEQNRMKYGGGSSSTTSSSTSTTTSRPSATNSPRPSAPKTPSQTSTTPQQSPQTKYDAHQQYKQGNLNVQESSYGEKIKNVSLWIKDGANYRSASLSGELYRKEGQFFVKIGGTFFRVGSIGGAYNSYIMYGMKAYYFNR